MDYDLKCKDTDNLLFYRIICNICNIIIEKKHLRKFPEVLY